MKATAIEVECYSGGRQDEHPRRITIDGATYTVAHLLGESIEEAVDSRDRLHRYRVLTEDGLTIEVLRDCNGSWYLLSKTLRLR